MHRDRAEGRVRSGIELHALGHPRDEVLRNGDDLGVVGHPWQQDCLARADCRGHSTDVALLIAGVVAASLSVSPDGVDERLQSGDVARLGGVLVDLDLTQRLGAHHVFDDVLHD